MQHLLKVGRSSLSGSEARGIASFLYVRYKMKSKAKTSLAQALKIVMNQGLTPRPQQWVVS
ncbi:hypothetical protein AXW67_22690 [Bradyrhizobium neotropicale]|uniref:Uncharacterized protein n=1 Tax=Bradyrhizobium neotropicale TaxID=1497615 RepID=A0A176YV71_9BRAD|nr:hypothetical protein AXW67_22690 [Bradyrhizobium neotropicale]